MAAAPVIVLERAILQDPGATQYLKLPMERHQSEIHASTPAQMVSSRVAQWNFLPRLFSETIVGDKSALSATKQTAQARLFRRILYGSLSTILAVYIVFLAVSYIHNLGLERRIANAAKTLPLLATDAISLPSLCAPSMNFVRSLSNSTATAATARRGVTGSGFTREMNSPPVRDISTSIASDRCFSIPRKLI
jgi:type VI protein secretion system component VasK